MEVPVTCTQTNPQRQISAQGTDMGEGSRLGSTRRYHRISASMPRALSHGCGSDMLLSNFWRTWTSVLTQTVNTAAVNLPLVGILFCTCIVEGHCTSVPHLINEGSSFPSDLPQIPVTSPDSLECILCFCFI